MNGTIFTEAEISELVRAQDWVYENAGKDWRDGLLVGNGSMAAIGYAPDSMEWVINKTDVFDGRVPKGRMLKHNELIKYLHDNNVRDSFFMDELEAVTEDSILRSISALIIRLSFGNGELGWSAPAFPEISQRLSLYDGELYSEISAHFLHAKTKCLTPRGRNIFIIRLEDSSDSDKEHYIEISRPYHDNMNPPVWEKGPNDEICFQQVLPGGIGEYAVAVKIVNRTRGAVPGYLQSSISPPAFYDNQEQSRDTRIGRYNVGVTQKGDMDLYVAVCSSYEYEDPLTEALQELNESVKIGFDLLEEENQNWWHIFWQRSAVSFEKYGDIQRYWYFSLYELGCSYGKAPVPALNGMVYGPLNAFNPGVGSSNYNSDQNLQIPLMPLPLTNHTDLIIPLIDTYANCMEELQRHTKYLFEKTGGEGVFTPLVSNQLGNEIPSRSYRYTMCGSAYTGLVLCWAWKYTRNDELMLTKIYPLLCKLIRFYINNLMLQDEKGTYYLDWTIPPEIFRFTRNDTATLSMLKTCMQTAVEFARLAGLDNDEICKWEDILANYPMLAKQVDGGWWGGPDVPLDHFCFATHLLYPFFPAGAYITPEDREATARTLEFIETSAFERTFADQNGRWHFLHGWSWFLANTARLRLGNYEFALEELNRFLEQFAKPNGLFSHNSILILPTEVTENNLNLVRNKDTLPNATDTHSWYTLNTSASPNIDSKRLASPVMEGNSILLFFATETLLQSFDGIIDLFPGVPGDFTGKFHRLLSNGGFEVSAVMECGQVKIIHIKSLSKNIVRLYDPWENKYIVFFCGTW
jgi:hypothetical protein